MIAIAKQKLIGIESLKSELEPILQDIRKNLEHVKQIYIQNVVNEENPDGLLTGLEADYLECLDLNHEKLNTLMNNDLSYWKNNLQRKEQQANKLSTQINLCLKEHSLKIEAILNQSSSRAAKPRSVKTPRVTLRRLQLWGNNVDKEEVNFEWPDQELMD